MNTIADQYYVKAIDQYPFNLEEALENLNYALSYNREHEGANYLMGKLHFEQFSNFTEAEKYYQIALANNPENHIVCVDYALLLIILNDFDKADKLIAYAQKIKGISLCSVFRLKGLKAEYQKKFSKAIACYEKAIMNAYETNTIDQLTDEIKRVKSKRKIKKNKKKFVPVK